MKRDQPAVKAAPVDREELRRPLTGKAERRNPWAEAEEAQRKFDKAMEFACERFRQQLERARA